MSIILTIDPAEDFSKVVSRLKNAKVKVSSVLEGLHIVMIEADKADLAKIRSVVGVIGAETDVPVKLDPQEVPRMGQGWPKPSDRITSPQVVGASWRSPAWDQQR